MDIMENKHFDLGKVIDQAINEALTKRGIVNILIAGRTGVGKSTLVNAIFQGNLATTGQGKPVTQNTREISKEGIPVNLFDTRGLELEHFKATMNELEDLVKTKRNDVNPQNHIHAAWICISENSRRVEDAEISLCELLAQYMPVVIVLTKCSSDNGFRNIVQSLLPKAKNVVRVNSIPETLDDGHVLKPFGLVELVDLTMEVVPEGQQAAFAASQKVSVQQKKTKSHKVVAGAATAAMTVGASPIPFSDAFLLVPIQVGMLAGITNVFGLDLKKSFLTTLVSSTITGAGATIIGRSIVTNLMKLVPGIGTIAGSVISAGTASAITVAFGEAYIATLAQLFSVKDAVDITGDDIIKEFKIRYK